MREYIIRRKPKSCDDEYCVEGKDCLARTVYEDDELIDIGITDSDGNKIMARKKLEIGFVRWKHPPTS